MQTAKNTFDFPDDFVKRFWNLINKNGDCWNWIGHTDKDGYGNMKSPDRKSLFRSHRIAWQISFGKIPKGLCVCHHCDNTRCCNPKHLWLGTPMENTQDKVLKNRQAKGETIASKRRGIYVGEKSGHHKLTESIVLYLRSKTFRHYSEMRQTAKVFGVEFRCIWNIVNRKTWTHI